MSKSPEALTKTLRQAARGLLLTAWLAVPSAQVSQAQPAADPLAEQLTHLALVLPADAFEQSFRQHLARGAAPHELSTALRQTLLNLRSQPPSSAGRWLVDYLMTSPAPVLTPHPESAAVMHDPYGLRGVAQGTWNTWTWRQWRLEVIDHGQRGSWKLLDELTAAAEHTGPAGMAAVRGAAAGIRELLPSELRHPALRTRLLNEPSLAPLTLSVAEVTGDEALLLEASQLWPKGRQAALTLRLADHVGTEKALEIWRGQLSTPGGTLKPYARQALGSMLVNESLPAAQAREIKLLLEQYP